MSFREVLYLSYSERNPHQEFVSPALKMQKITARKKKKRTKQCLEPWSTIEVWYLCKRSEVYLLDFRFYFIPRILFGFCIFTMMVLLVQYLLFTGQSWLFSALCNCQAISHVYVKILEFRGCFFFEASTAKSIRDEKSLHHCIVKMIFLVIHILCTQHMPSSTKHNLIATTCITI